MAAITGNMEQGEVIDASGILGGLSGVRETPRSLEAMHKGLTGSHWVRSALGWYMQKVKIRHEWSGDTLLLRVVDAPMKDAEGPYIPRNAVPWYQMPKPVRGAKVWSHTNGKMDCPVFDLPAGAKSAGGSCPGADEGQSIVAERHGTLRGTDDPAALLRDVPLNQQVDLRTTICMACYAETGPIAYTSNQLSQLMRHIWSAGMINSHYDAFVDVLATSLLKMDESLFGGACAPGAILPIRLHGGGDFYSEKYARAWIDVANTVAASGSKGARMRFWAPTRTWATKGWTELWRTRLLPRLRQPNFVVRPSSFHFDNPAPGPFLPGSGEGSTSMFLRNKKEEMDRKNFHAQGDEKKFFDWQCPAYSLKEAKSCTESPNPMGRKHCRACWIRPDLRINYPAH